MICTMTMKQSWQVALKSLYPNISYWMCLIVKLIHKKGGESHKNCQGPYQLPFTWAWTSVHRCNPNPVISTFKGSPFFPPGTPFHPRGAIEVAVRITGDSTICPSSTEPATERPSHCCRCVYCCSCSIPKKDEGLSPMHRS